MSNTLNKIAFIPNLLNSILLNNLLKKSRNNEIISKLNFILDQMVNLEDKIENIERNKNAIEKGNLNLIKNENYQALCSEIKKRSDALNYCSKKIYNDFIREETNEINKFVKHHDFKNLNNIKQENSFLKIITKLKLIVISIVLLAMSTTLIYQKLQTKEQQKIYKISSFFNKEEKISSRNLINNSVQKKTVEFPNLSINNF